MARESEVIVMKHKELTFVRATNLANEYMETHKRAPMENAIVVSLEMHPDGSWTFKYIKDDPFVLYEVPLN